MKRWIHASYRYIGKDSIDMSPYVSKGFDDDQLDIIERTLSAGFDASLLADTRYDWKQMSEIYEGFKSGVDPGIYADPEYDYQQMTVIREGLEHGVDVSTYADPKYDARQMYKILDSLLSKKSKPLTWKRAVQTISDEINDGIDPFYEQTEAGEYVEGMCREVEESMTLFLEPSVQAGIGTITFYDEDMLLGYYDYTDFNVELAHIVVSSTSKSNFKKAYEKFLKNIVKDLDRSDE